MSLEQLDRKQLRFYDLAERPTNKQFADRDMIDLGAAPARLTPQANESVACTARRMMRARETGRPVILAFGAHTIKNGLGPILIRLAEEGWVQHLATNGAGIIHDWEFAFQGKTSEDVRENTANGQFGMWRETGLNLNLALLLGAYRGLGYGESVGQFIAAEEHRIPERDELTACLEQAARGMMPPARAAAAADVLAGFDVLEEAGLEPGVVPVPHPWKEFSVQRAAVEAHVPFTGHPMIGHDIIYTHPMNNCAAIGRAAQRDFLAYANQVSNLSDGVYLSIGSAVMSPMVFEKSLSMAQNIALQEGQRIQGHFIVVVDLAQSHWNWDQGEPPQDSPDYYLRYCKTFSRMGGTMRYVTADNRDFLLGLARELGVSA